MREQSDAYAFARESLEAYAVFQWRNFVCEPHHRLLIHHLEAVEAGRLDRLIVSMPPRHGKSEITSKVFPSWYLGRHPDRYVIGGTYNQHFANAWGRKVRDFMRTQAHLETFRDCRIRPDAASVKEIGLTEGGAYYAIGANGSGTGRGAHVAVVDDPFKDAKEASSEVIREARKEWWRSVITTRLERPHGACVMVLTRWHDDDLAGWQIREHPEERWHVINLPALALENDPLGRAPGEALWPGKYPVEELARIKKAVGPYYWSALFQQNPIPDGGRIFDRSWMRYYREKPAKFDRIVISFDFTFKDTDGTDYVVGTVWGAADGAFYLLDLVRDRMGFTESVKAMEMLTLKWPSYSHIYIEDKANGPAVIDTCKRKIKRMVAVEPMGSKQARAYAVQGLFEAGNVLLPDGAPWLSDYVGEMCAFPTGKNDDQVDSTTQALLKLDAPRRANGLMPSMVLGV
jgi:predicted phage terminase large subunit-like protein